MTSMLGSTCFLSILFTYYQCIFSPPNYSDEDKGKTVIIMHTMHVTLDHVLHLISMIVSLKVNSSVIVISSYKMFHVASFKVSKDTSYNDIFGVSRNQIIFIMQYINNRKSDVIHKSLHV